MTSSVEHVSAPDGTRLLVRHWRAQGDRPSARVLIVHGLAEHSGRYEHVGDAFAEAGMDAQGIDLRGFGGSGGPRASVERFGRFHDDVEERLVAMRAAAPAAAVVLYGHSMGGLVSLGYALDPGRSMPDLLVLSAPAIAAALPAWQCALVGVLRHVAPGTSVPNKLSGDQLSRDPAVGAAYAADPLNVHHSTIRLGAASFDEMARVLASLDRLSIPTLVIHGGADPLVPTATSEVLAGLPGVTRVVHDGLRHETHNEPERDDVIAGVIEWIRANLPPPA
jgi:acylglycerol lipase